MNRAQCLLLLVLAMSVSCEGPLSDSTGKVASAKPLAGAASNIQPRKATVAANSVATPYQDGPKKDEVERAAEPSINPSIEAAIRNLTAQLETRDREAVPGSAEASGGRKPPFH